MSDETAVGDGAGRTGAAGGGQIRVFLLDDHELVRRGVAELLAAEPDLVVVGQAGTAAEAMERAEAARPDVALLDVRLPDGSGIEVCRELRSRMPGAGFLMLTSFADDEALFGAIMAGASGYVLKDIRGSALVDAVRTVAAGGSLLDPTATGLVLSRLRTPAGGDGDGNGAGGRAGGRPDGSGRSGDSGTRPGGAGRGAGPGPGAEAAVDARIALLTPSERRILELIAEGLTNRQIGERLFLAEKTVKNYVTGILAKLEMQRRTQAAAFAVRHLPSR